MVIIFRTSKGTILQVLKKAMYGLQGEPANISPGDLILLSVVGDPQIVASMIFTRARPDKANESDAIWGRHFPILLDCRDARMLRTPFLMSDHQVTDHNYGPGGTTVYVQKADADVLRKKGLLETMGWDEYFATLE